MIEEWKPIIIDGKEYQGYSISNYGRLQSHLKVCTAILERNERGHVKKTQTTSVIDINNSYELIPKKRRNKDKTIHKLCCNIVLPLDFFQDTVSPDLEYCIHRGKFKVEKSIHKLVMDAFRPIDQFPPFPKEDWDNTPESIKKWVRLTTYINHIDHNPENNRLDNLEYVTPRDNTRKATKQYGGNVANKKKFLEEATKNE